MSSPKRFFIGLFVLVLVLVVGYGVQKKMGPGLKSDVLQTNDPFTVVKELVSHSVLTASDECKEMAKTESELVVESLNKQITRDFAGKLNQFRLSYLEKCTDCKTVRERIEEVKSARDSKATRRSDIPYYNEILGVLDLVEKRCFKDGQIPFEGSESESANDKSNDDF